MGIGILDGDAELVLVVELMEYDGLESFGTLMSLAILHGLTLGVTSLVGVPTDAAGVTVSLRGELSDAEGRILQTWTTRATRSDIAGIYYPGACPSCEAFSAASAELLEKIDHDLPAIERALARTGGKAP